MAIKTKMSDGRDLILQDPSITLKEIAATYGFYDEYHFSKSYKKIMGYPPKQTKRQ